MKYLSGKFFLRQDSDGYRTGQVVEVAEAAVLIKYDQMGADPIDESWSFPMELLSFDEIACSDVDGVGKRWGFFDDRAQMNGYIDWLLAPRAEDHQPRVGARLQ